MFAIDSLQPCFIFNPSQSIMQQSNPDNAYYPATNNRSSSPSSTSNNSNGFALQYPNDYYINNEYMISSSSCSSPTFNIPANWSYSPCSLAPMAPVSPAQATNYISMSNVNNGTVTASTSECSSPTSVCSQMSPFDFSASLIPVHTPTQFHAQIPAHSNPSSPNMLMASAAAAAATALAVGSVSPSHPVSSSSLHSSPTNICVKRVKPKSPSSNSFKTLKSPKSAQSHNVCKTPATKTKRSKNLASPSASVEPLEKKHQCQICGKYFRRDLPRHLRTHLEITRFECPFPRDICPHKQGHFNRPYDFKKHLLHGHFVFDDQKKVRSFRDLQQKLSHSGTCRCGLRFTAGEWLDKHVLDGTNRCPFLVKIPKDNLAATRALVSEQLQNASTSVSVKEVQQQQQQQNFLNQHLDQHLDHQSQYQLSNPMPMGFQQLPSNLLPDHSISSSSLSSSPIPSSHAASASIYDQLQPAHLHYQQLFANLQPPSPDQDTTFMTSQQLI